jgi:hypothetical protein
MNIKVNVGVPEQRVLAHLNNWFECNTESWAVKAKLILKEGLHFSDFLVGAKLNPQENYNCALAVIATTPDCSVILTCEETDDGSETKDYVLNLETIERGLQVMADKYPKHFFDLYRECGGDIITSDVFVQCCLFGEIVFG